MKQKTYCSQCHHSVFTWAARTRQIQLFRKNRVCLYCYKRRRFFPPDKLIDGCKYLLPEDRQKYLDGTWNANMADAAHEY